MLSVIDDLLLREIDWAVPMGLWAGLFFSVHMSLGVRQSTTEGFSGMSTVNPGETTSALCVTVDPRRRRPIAINRARWIHISCLTFAWGLLHSRSSKFPSMSSYFFVKLTRNNPMKAGPGRPKGSKNRLKWEISEVARSFVESRAYLESLEARLIAGKAPHMEQLLFYYAYGKPVDRIELVGPMVKEVYRLAESYGMTVHEVLTEAEAIASCRS
jgi:hypothetical protein